MTYLYSKNPSIGGEAKTKLDAAPSSGATSITVENTQGFSANDYVVVGDLGTDLAEIQRVTSVTNNTAIAVTALKFAHVLDEPVQRIPYNQTRFYVATGETAASSLIVTKDIDPTASDKNTAFNYEAGLNTDWFQASWYNSNSSTETIKTALKQADPMYCSVQDVEAFLNRKFGADSDIPFDTITSAIIQNTKLIESETNSAFRPISMPTSSFEYHDGKPSSDPTYFLNNGPIISVETLQTTTSSEDTASADVSWTTLVEDSDFFVDKETKRVAVVDELPTKGRNRVRVAYTYGRNSVPADVKKLCVFIVAKDLMLGGAARSVSEGRSPNIQLDWLDAEIDRLIMKYRVHPDRNS